MKFAFYTLGCKVNQYETQAMEQRLRQLGHCLGSWDEVCDGYIINTCTVTAVSDRKSRTAIRQARRRNPDAVIGVCGCYSQTHPEDIRALDVDILAGTADRMAFLEAVAGEAARRQSRPAAGGGPSPADGAADRPEILPAAGISGDAAPRGADGTEQAGRRAGRRLRPGRRRRTVFQRRTVLRRSPGRLPERTSARCRRSGSGPPTTGSLRRCRPAAWRPGPAPC